MSPLFSVCIPVFKSEEYIGFAVKDMLNQTYRDYECIIIDDQSPDKAMDVAEDLIRGDDRFTIIRNKKNLGVSETRNKGLKMAKGEYVIFLDSDDRYDERLLESIETQVNEAKSRGKLLDVITWEFGAVGENNEKLKMLENWRRHQLEKHQKPTDIYEPAALGDALFQVNLNSMCVKSFRTDHLVKNNITFDSSIKFGEDALASYKAICLAQYIAAIPGDDILYYYRRNQADSAMHTISFSSQMRDQLKVIVELKSFLEQHGLARVYQATFMKWVSDGAGSIVSRMNTFYASQNEAVEEKINTVTHSRAWRFTQRVRDLKRTISS